MSNTLFNERKTAQAAALLLFRAGGQLPLIKLMKLLYLAERQSLKQYGEPISGDKLVSMDNGPVLSKTLDYINGAVLSCDGGWDTWVSDRADHMVALRDASMIRSPEQDLLALSDSDIEVLDAVWAEFGHWDRWALVSYTHDKLPEWQDPHGSALPISYTSLFSALGYDNTQTGALTNHLLAQANLAELNR
ncbi:MAG: Panacea domain-containing protein [Rhodoferax sp.]|jgi:uncharacterized phage-associated protein|uniref:Panacea domain-containing protein n=1 Tax=Rhodoferax sp. TaxID=50421 RepID=UPI003BB51356